MTELSSAATTAAAGTTGFLAPGTTPEKTPRGYTPGLAAVNFGVYPALLTPVLVSMAFKVQHITATPEEATAQLGLIMGAGSFLSVALAGAVLVYRIKGVK